MNKNIYFPLLAILLNLYIIDIKGQTDQFSRIDTISVPEIDNCGFGEFISGVDFDGDGFLELYAVNNMNDIGGNELIPRIYKYENMGEGWELVWEEYARDIPQQNSWAPITHGDWDNDGKMEIIWAPANNLSGENPNPPRILVWETGEDDRMGAPNFGFDTPNAQWSITDVDNFEVRPFKMKLNDIDSDGTQELIFADRQSNYRFGIISISDVPDNGGGMEEWTLEFSGLELELSDATIYDMATIGNKLYLFHTDGNLSVIKYENDEYIYSGDFTGILPGGSWKSSSVLDINNDGTMEIVVGGWQTGNGDVHNKVFLIEEDAFLGVKVTQIADFESLLTLSGRINGGHGAFGDVDNDGNMDMIFGSREAQPSVAILRVEHQGGTISDPNNYQVSLVDSLFPTLNPGRYDIISVSNLDDDPEDEILYTNGNTCERFPIVVLDYNKPVSVSDTKIHDKFYLAQNYPNPFNPTTTISFHIPKETIVNLILFNTIGESVLTLISNEIFREGSYNYNFQAQNLPSGVYYYMLKTEFGTLSRKMILMK